MPNWHPFNLRKHYRDRLRKDPGCFPELLQSESRYELRADAAVDNAWCIFEGEGWDVEKREYSESRLYYVDNDLVVAITDCFNRYFVTCFHEHFHRPHGVVPEATLGQKQLRYRQQLKIDEGGKAIRNLRRIKGV